MSVQDTSKLPQWAQREIARLTVNLEAAKRELAAALGNEPTSIEVDPYRHVGAVSSDHRTFLRERILIRFTTKSGILDVMVRDGVLEVSAARGMIRVAPWAANVVRLEAIEP